MCKIAFISDIHGNYPALLAVLKDIQKRSVDKIYCLGDLVGYYCQINEVIDTIREYKIPCIMGNHDYALGYNHGVIERSKTCTNVLTNQLKYISYHNLEFIRTLNDSITIDIKEGKIFCVHGGLNNHIDEYIENLTDDYFSFLSNDITHVVSAHNHKAVINSFSNIIYANTGSVGQPRDHDPRASYIIYEGGKFQNIRVSYDIDKIVKVMLEYGYPNYISEVLYKGFRIGEK